MSETQVKQVRVIKGTQAQIDAHQSDILPTDLVVVTDAPEIAIKDDIHDAQITITVNDAEAGSFTTNQNTTDTINIDVPTGAGDISYTNPDYPTVEAALDKLLYVAPAISTFSGGGTYETGSSRSSVTFTYKFNKKMQRAEIRTSNSFTSGTLIAELDVTAVSANKTVSYTPATPIKSNTTFYCVISDGTQTKTASTAISFTYKRYYGVNANPSITDAEILLLSSDLNSARAQTRTFNCSGGKYFYLVIPTSSCTGIKFKVGGLSFSDMNVVTRTITNASGGKTSYNIYRPNNIQTGAAIAVEVS